MYYTHSIVTVHMFTVSEYKNILKCFWNYVWINFSVVFYIVYGILIITEF